MSGIILLNKPRHLSSFSAVNIVRKCVGAKKAGHLGTLDVEAEGLLVITLDNATKLFDMYLKKDKQYLSTFCFGQETDTFDLEGTITRTDDKIITREMIEKVIPSFIGKQMQLPPNFSAKKVGGKKAYDLARLGKEVPLEKKEVEIYDLSVEKEVSKNLFTFKISCSSGTYIRSICRDVASALSTCAVCYDIIRTRCGEFQLKDALTLEEIKKGKCKIIPCEELFDYEKLNITQTEEEKLLQGQILKTDVKDGEYRLFQNTFLGIGRVKGGLLKLEMRLN